ncbi:uncharacterized protein LOC143470013 isoform X2 [Clavelina lepadiformis]|uniref:uncharacterized protein LOC143470013 isoform X2 n=1 Tax=Clavelina lepadiformis TaxID=159417 RepID=UPI0040411697
MPQLNPDEAANDERKIFNDESVGEDEVGGWQDSELNDIKDDLVDEDDVEPVRPSYDNKVSSHRNGESTRRSKDEIERDGPTEQATSRSSFPYPPQQDIGSLVSGLGLPHFPSMPQVPYSPYVPYVNPLLYGASSPTDMDGKQAPPHGAHPDVPPMYSLPGQLGQIPNPLAPWSPNPLYNSLCTASAMTGMLRYPYPFHNFSSSGAINSVPPFPLVPSNPHAGGIHPGMLPHTGISLSGAMMNGQGGGKALSDKKSLNPDQAPAKRRENKSEKPTRPYVKKPLNAFMIYMKEQRAQVVAECTLKESAAINQILGRKWHSLNRDEQQKYYEMARKERQLHMQMFPGWSARDNYGKRKKRKKEKAQDCTAQNPKKCRAVYGLEQQQLWRKKKCIRYQHDDDSDDGSETSPSHYQTSPDDSMSQSMVANQSSTFDSTEQSMTSQSSTSGIGSSVESHSGSSLLGERLSPPQPLNEQIKQEKSPPQPLDQGSGNPAKGVIGNPLELFHPPTSNFHSGSNDGCHDNCAKRVRGRDTSDQFSNGKDNCYRGMNGVEKSVPEARGRRSNSGPLDLQRGQNLFNTPVLSPNGMGLNSPHANPSLFPQFSYLAAAARLPPTSALSGIMGFPGLKGLGSPMGMGMGLTGPGTSVAAGGHPGANAARHVTSALEGKS